LLVTTPDPILTLVAELGIPRNSDLKARGIHPQQLRRLVDAGALVRVSRGLYTLPTADLTLGETRPLLWLVKTYQGKACRGAKNPLFELINLQADWR
jgi:hypothetical protein